MTSEIGIFDWCLLFVQIAILLGIATHELVRRSGRNIFAIIICLTFLVLVQGQTFWVFNQITDFHLARFNHIQQSFTVDAARRANAYLCVCAVALGLTYTWTSILYSERTTNIKTRSRNLVFPPLADAFAGGGTLLFAVALVMSAGGLVAAATKPGQNFSAGVTMLMIAAGIGKFPFLRKIMAGASPNLSEYFLLAITFLITLLNSRFIAAFIVLQIAVFYNYYVHEVSRRILVILGVVMFLIFIVFGLYRHFTSLPSSLISIETLVAFLRSSEANPFDWFYSLNIEGFVGLAGLLTFADSQGGIVHDYGLSTIAFVFQFIPNFLRNDPTLPITSWQQAFLNAYPYNGSIIRPGPEIAYAHFGILGLVGLGASLGWLSHWLHRMFMRRGEGRLSISAMSVHSLQLIRGTFYLAFFFAVSEWIMAKIYMTMVEFSLILTRSISTSDREYK